MFHPRFALIALRFIFVPVPGASLPPATNLQTFPPEADQPAAGGLLHVFRCHTEQAFYPTRIREFASWGRTPEVVVFLERNGGFLGTDECLPLAIRWLPFIMVGRILDVVGEINGDS